MTKQIEVLAGDDAPKVFKLKKEVMTLGSSFECDIVVTHSDISRKHVKFEIKDDNVFVTDMGSTNGSYFADQKMVPGKKNEFTKFVSLRLGTDVLITLLEVEDQEQEAEKTRLDLKIPQPNTESTRVISLADLKNAKTEKLVKQRQTTRANRPTTKKAPKKTSENWGVIMVVMAVVGYVSWTIYKKVILESNLDTPPTALLKPRPKPVKVEVSKFLVDKEALPTREYIKEHENEPKCQTDVEKYLCQNFPTSQGWFLGTFQKGSMIYVYLNGTDFIKIATEYLKRYQENPEPQDIYKTAGMLFFKNSFGQEFNYDMIKSLDITFVFYNVEFPQAQEETPPEVITNLPQETVQVDPATGETNVPEQDPVLVQDQSPAQEPATGQPAFSQDTQAPSSTADVQLNLAFMMSMRTNAIAELKPKINDTHFEGVQRVGAIIFAFVDDYITFIW